MRRFATAGSAVQQRYICLPCQQRLFQRDCLSRAPQTWSEHERSFSLRAQLFSQEPDAESKTRDIPDTTAKESGPEVEHLRKSERHTEAGSATQPTKKSKKKAEKQHDDGGGEEAKVEEPTTKDGITSKETLQRATKPSTRKGETKSGEIAKKNPSSRAERLLAKRSKKQELKAEKSKAKLEGGDTKKDPSLVTALTSDVGSVKTRIKRLRAKLQRQRAKKSVGPTYKLMVNDHSKLRSRVQRLEEEVKGALSSGAAANAKQYRKLSTLQSVLPDLLRILDANQPEERKESAEPIKREWRAVANLRRAGMLKELISMVDERKDSQLDQSEASARTENSITDDMKGGYLQTLMDELPEMEVIVDDTSTNKPPVIRMRQNLRGLIPEIEPPDEIHLLRMFREHLEDRAARPALSQRRSSNVSSATRARARDGDPIRIEASAHPVFSIEVNSKDLKSLTKDLIKSKDFALEPIQIEQPPVRGLAYGLDRVLFNPGVAVLQDTRSRVYNFDPYLENIMPVGEFNFDLLRGFTTSSKDETLQSIAKEQGKRYLGSSSSMTGILSQYHFLLSRFRNITLDSISRSFETSDFHHQHTSIMKGPAAVLLRWKKDRGIYAIDAQKEFDEMNVLSMLGHSLERLLTLPTDEYEKFRKPEADQAPHEDVNEPESYHYTGFGDLLMRSQLDAYDSRLPGTGMFDLKTRAVLPVRMDVSEHLANCDYEIRFHNGKFESYEREYVDMVRATMLKYMLQVRIGRMDGIFVAYHNTRRIFGFQYVPVEELDLALHGQRDRSLGDEEFKLSLKLMNEAFNRATQRLPEQTLQMYFSTSGGRTRTKMHVFVEPMSDADADELQNQNNERNQAITREILASRAPTYDKQSRRIFPLQEHNERYPTETTEAVTEAAEADKAATSSGDEDAALMVGNDHESAPASELSTGDEILVEQNSGSKEDVEDGAESTSEADPKADDGVDGEQASIIAQSKAPLLAMELTLENYVDGKPVPAPGFIQKPPQPTDRCEDVSAKFSNKNGDQWSIMYDYKEIKDPQKAWELYLNCKKQRKNLIDYERDTSGIATIRRALKPYVNNGRQHRLRRDLKEKGQVKVVLGDIPRREG